MKIKTKFFGETDISEEDVIFFKEGIPGFEEHKKYAVLNIEDSKIVCIQCIDAERVCLVAASPWDYFKKYEINISDAEIEELNIKVESDAAIYNVLSISKDKTTMNLLAPVVINFKEKLGKQIIMDGTKYSIRQEIACL